MRNTKTVTATYGRDRGTRFVLTELPAADAEEWFIRAMSLLARAGSDVPADIFQHGPAGFVVLGIASALAGLGKAPFEDQKPLLDRMMTCVGVQSPDGTTVHTDRRIVDEMIQEVATRLWLREEVVSLHLGFSLAARLSELKGLVATLTTPTAAATGSSNTPTSGAASAPS